MNNYLFLNRKGNLFLMATIQCQHLFCLSINFPSFVWHCHHGHVMSQLARMQIPKHIFSLYFRGGDMRDLWWYLCKFVWWFEPACLGKYTAHVQICTESKSSVYNCSWLYGCWMLKVWGALKRIRRGENVWTRLDSYAWERQCRRRSNRWMALRRWLPVCRQATPTCHSQMSASGRWPSTWSSANICFSISNPDWRWEKGQRRWHIYHHSLWAQPVIVCCITWSHVKYLSGTVLCGLL